MEFSTVTVSGKGQICIPTKIRERTGIKKGETLVIFEEGCRITLESASEVRRRLKAIQNSETLIASEKSLAKDWLSKEDEEAWKDL